MTKKPPRERPKTIGERLREARLLAGVSQKSLNREAELGRGHLSHIESNRRGARMRKATIDRLRTALANHGVTVTELWLRKGEGPAPARSAA